MSRTLPESTVDAWTAIELARARSPWIWLPTTNQGASWTGSHPGDVSSLLGARLVIIENKGIEAGTDIDFGSKWQSQHAYLRAVEEVGNSIVSVAPVLGWVFFGLPLRRGATFGSDWSGFPQWHHLACPHKVHLLTVGRTASISDLQTTFKTHSVLHLPPGAFVDPFVGLFGDLRLSQLASACDLGLAGLQLSSDYSQALGQVRRLVDGARRAWTDAGDTESRPAQPPFFNGDGILELLDELSALAAAWAGHVTLTIFPSNGSDLED